MLGQYEIANYLKRCNGDRIAIEEVLCGYVVWKYVKGRNTEHILRKIRELRMWLAVTGESAILRASHRVFTMLIIECTMVHQSRLGVSPTTTPVGKEVWNCIRRNMSSAQRRVITDSQYGGPAPIQAILTPGQRNASPSIVEGSERPPWVERYFMLRPQFGNEGVPAYPEGSTRRDSEALPAYRRSISDRSEAPNGRWASSLGSVPGYRPTLSDHLSLFERGRRRSHGSTTSIPISAH